MSSNKTRETITFSCDPELKKLIEFKVRELGYQNKSQMIRDALQSFFESEEFLQRMAGDLKIILLVSVLYDHDDLTTVKQFLSVQHESHVAYSTHHHITKEECLENLIVHDTVDNVREFLTRLRSIAGLKNVSVKVISRTEIIMT
ncbi:MAG: CopG family ribbon-helix-helix protein [Candidatus Hodarchaeales archaeon]